MRKIIIYFLIISILFLNFAKAQIDPSDLLKVPVIDAKAVMLLGEIMTLLQDELKKLNLSTSLNLGSQLQQIGDEIAADSLKTQQYMEILSESEMMLQLRRDKVQDQKAYQEALEEAKIVGAYLGLSEFIQRVGSCLNPRIREQLTNYLMTISENYKIDLKVKELLDAIPDCPKETITTVAVKPNFFAWLTQPFKLNLAQVSQNGTGEIPPIIITPAFQDTEDSIELTSFQTLGFNLITEQSQEQEEKRKQEIGNIWSIEPECLKFIGPDPNINGGKPVCQKYQTLIQGQDLEKFRQELALNSSLNNPAKDINAYKVTGMTRQLLAQTGLQIPSIEEANDFSGTLSQESRIKEIATKVCDSIYKQSEKNSPRDYALCLRTSTEHLKTVAEIQKEKLGAKMNHVEQARTRMSEVLSRAEAVKSQIDPGVCPGAAQDLEEIIGKLGGIITTYTYLIDQIRHTIFELEFLIRQIANYVTQIISLIERLFELLQSITDKQRNPILNLIFNTIFGLLGQFLGIDVQWLLNTIIDNIQDVLDLANDSTREILEQFRNLIQPFSETITKFNNLMFQINRERLTASSVLNDLYELNLIEQRIEAYARAVEGKRCSSEGLLGNISLIKNQVIVVENPKEQKKSFNFFASLKNLFEPKIVEIRNEK